MTLRISPAGLALAGLPLAGLPLVLAACSSPPPPRVSPPAPVATAAAAPGLSAAPAAPLSPAVSRQPADWTDWPLAQGRWDYRRDARGSLALYGVPGRDALITLRCDIQRGRLYLSRAKENAAPAGPLTLRSSAALKTFAAQVVSDNAAYIAAEIRPGDDILDAVAYTRGRIAIETSGQQSIAIPVWSELPRVIEDCRS